MTIKIIEKSIFKKARKKPYGHKEYTRVTPTGKIAQVGAKGAKPEDSKTKFTITIGNEETHEGEAKNYTKMLEDVANWNDIHVEKTKGKPGKFTITIGTDETHEGEAKNYTKMLEQVLVSNDIRVTPSTGEDFAARKKPARHVRMRSGKPYQAGAGVREPFVRRLAKPSQEVYKYIDSHSVRKPVEDSDFGTGDIIDMTQAPPEVANFIRNLDFHNANDVYAEGHQAEWTMDEFTKEMPQYFGLYKNGVPYLVNTEGYKYPRYVARITGKIAEHRQ